MKHSMFLSTAAVDFSDVQFIRSFVIAILTQYLNY